jgi:hypothetical protein
MRRRLFFFAPFAIVGIFAFMALGGFVVETLWNRLLPDIFGWRTITFWQAIGLMVLARLLFGGVGRHAFGPSGMKRRIRERIEMSADERERFRRGMHGAAD